MSIVRVFGFEVEAEVLGRLKRVEFSDEASYLRINGVKHEEALAILHSLSTGTLASVQRQVAESVGAELPGSGRTNGEILASQAPAPAPDPAQVSRKVAEELGTLAKTRRASRKAPPDPSEAPPAAEAAPAPVPAPLPAEVRAPEPAPPPPSAPLPGPVNGSPNTPPPSLPNGTAVASEPPTDPWKLAHPPGTNPDAPPAALPAPAATAPAPVPEGGQHYDLEVMRRATTIRAVLQHLIERGYNEPDTITAACREIKDHVPVLSRVVGLEDRLARAFEVMGIGAPA
jgi:hypothetical protein